MHMNTRWGVVNRQGLGWHHIESFAVDLVHKHAAVEAKHLQRVLHLNRTLFGAVGWGPAQFAEEGIEFCDVFLVEACEEAYVELDFIAQYCHSSVVAI